jgi:acid phosphatase class B
MRNIRRSVALALAAIMMMAMNMVSFAADTAPAETEAVESVTRSTNGESVLLDKVYFACDGKNTISSREPIPATALDIENRILGSMEYFYDGLDSSGRPQYL